MSSLLAYTSIRVILRIRDPRHRAFCPLGLLDVSRREVSDGEEETRRGALISWKMPRQPAASMLRRKNGRPAARLFIKREIDDAHGWLREKKARR